MSHKGNSRPKWKVNFWVDVVIGLAFAVTAVTGIIKYLPAGWFGGPSASPLGVSYALWTDIHDWSGFVIVGGIVLHAALHWSWITSTTRRTFGLQKTPRQTGGTAAGSAARAARATVTAAASATGGGATAQAASPTTSARRTPAAVAAAAPGGEASAFVAASPPPEGPRFTRRRFLAGTAVALAAVGAGAAIGKLSADTDTVEAADTAAANGSADASASGPVDTTDGSEASTGSGVAQESPARVTVDAGRCTGCGDCLAACPDGVFAAGSDGRTVIAQNPDACRLCGRCLHVCRAGAITLNA